MKRKTSTKWNESINVYEIIYNIFYCKLWNWGIVVWKVW